MSVTSEDDEVVIIAKDEEVPVSEFARGATWNLASLTQGLRWVGYRAMRPRFSYDRFSNTHDAHSRNLNQDETLEEQDRIDKVFRLVTSENVTFTADIPGSTRVIYAENFVRLGPKGWLEDNVVDAYCYLLLSESVLRPAENRVRILNAFFFTRNPGDTVDVFQKRVIRMTSGRPEERMLQFLQYTYAFPYNINDNHWIAVIANNDMHTFTVFDSLQGNCEAIETKIREKVEPAFNYIRAQVDAPASKWTIVFADTPQQENYYDCGVFACAKLASLVAGSREPFTQTDVVAFRRHMALEILRHSTTNAEPAPTEVKLRTEGPDGVIVIDSD
jgi:Ulp1 family protease